MTNKCSKITFEVPYATSIRKSIRPIFVFFLVVFSLMYLYGELTSTVDFDVIFLVKYYAIAVTVALAFAIWSVFFDFVRIEFDENGIHLFSTAKLKLHLGRSKYVPYASLNVIEWKYWKVKEFYNLKIISNGRHVTNLGELVWKEYYMQIKEQVRNRIPIERFKVFEIW